MNRTDAGDQISKWLESQGYRQANKDYRAYIEEYKAWYKGYFKAFHDCRVQISATTTKRLKRYSLGAAKMVCEDYASLLLNEKVTIVSDQFKALPDLLDANRFLERGNRLVEWSFALGTGALVEFMNDQSEPTIDYIRGDLIYPLNWDGDSITECAFGSMRVLGSKQDSGEGYYIQIHELRDGKYYARNAWLDDKGKQLETPEGVVEEAGPYDVPMFQIIRPNVVNIADPDSPMGMAIFGDAIDQIKAVDLIYDSYVNEFQLGKKRLMVPMGFAQLQLQDDGTMKPAFDPNDLIYQVYQVPDGSTDKLQSIDMTLRASEHETGLQRMIDLLSKKCGLGTGRYQFEAGAAKTATEVVSINSDLYQSLKRHEKNLERAIVGMVKALAVLSGISPDIDVSVSFDDSIIEDTNALTQRQVELVNARLQSRKGAIMAIYNVDEAEAERKMQEIAEDDTVGLPAVDNANDNPVE